jgi:hypothetical protein
VSSKPTIEVLPLVKTPTIEVIGRKGERYHIVREFPEIHVRNNFVSGHLRTRGTAEGQYPLPYLDMTGTVFGCEGNTIEVCSRHVKVDDRSTAFTVDINPDCNPSLVADAQTLKQVPDGAFSRFRADPPYNISTAAKMYGTSLPSSYKILEAGARVCKKGALLFLLLGPTNYQWCPPNVKRVGCILLTVVPNNEIRCCNIYYKHSGA